MPRHESPHFDVLILGSHPVTYFAAALLRGKSALKVLHSNLPETVQPDRLVLINPEFFNLHPPLAAVRRKLSLTSLYGLHFLSDDVAIHREHRAKSAMALVGSYSEIRDAMRKMAVEAGAEMVEPAAVHVHRLDETGLDAKLDSRVIRAKALLLGAEVSEMQRKILGLPEAWEREVVHQYCYADLEAGCNVELARPVAPMSLNLKQTLGWAWLLQHEGRTQVSISIPMNGPTAADPADLLNHWLVTLKKFGIVTGNAGLREIHRIKLPLAGAMVSEGVADRTLLIGPAGGFYSACAEDIYPNCWSAIFAVDAIRKALKETHLQDALQLYPHKWRTTLGDYLRGPQQNLRFLLPMVYRNQVMTTRLTESILQGKSVVR